MTRNILIATIFSLATAVLLGVIFLGEKQRLPEASATTTAIRLERGARDFSQYCATCHGLAGQGQVQYGAPQLNNIVWRYTNAQPGQPAPIDQQFGIKEKYGTLRNYIQATLYSGVRGAAMPAFGAQGTLRQDQIENITDYVLSLNIGQEQNNLPQVAIDSANRVATQQAPTPDPNANPVSQGEIVFKQKGCAACHGLADKKLVGPGLGGLFQPGGTAAFGTQLPNGKPVNEENVRDWIQKANVGYPDAQKQGQNGESYSLMPAIALSDKEWQQLLVWLKAHKRDGSLTDEANKLIQDAKKGQGGPAPQVTTQPTGQPNNPAAPNSPAGPGSTSTP